MMNFCDTTETATPPKCIQLLRGTQASGSGYLFNLGVLVLWNYHMKRCSRFIISCYIFDMYMMGF
jgi:hypothetical protein